MNVGLPSRVTSPPKILLVEDEAEMRGLLTDNLEFEEYQVVAVGTAEDGLRELVRQQPALIIVDVMLPAMSGFEFCRQVRSRGLQLPIIMLTARTDESDRVVGLDLGADDYVSKPFGVRELMARIRARLRRAEDQTKDRDEYIVGNIRVNVRHRLATRHGRRLDLSHREFDLLHYLLAHRGEVVSREQLLREVWGYNHTSITRTVDNFVAKLRSHIEPRPYEPRHIITVHGIGYQLL